MTLDIEQPGGIGLVTARECENAGDEHPFGVGQPRDGLVLDHARFRNCVVDAELGRRGANFVRQMNHVDCTICAEQECPLDRIP